MDKGVARLDMGVPVMPWKASPGPAVLRPGMGVRARRLPAVLYLFSLHYGKRHNLLSGSLARDTQAPCLQDPCRCLDCHMLSSHACAGSPQLCNISRR